MQADTTKTQGDAKVQVAAERLQRLRGYLALDPHNHSLLIDTAGAAIAANAWEEANGLAERCAEAGAPLPVRLRVQVLHHLGRLDEALALGAGDAAGDAKDPDLLGALSLVAMDARDIALSRRYAEQAGAGADALSTLGLLALDDGEAEAAERLLDDALRQRPDHPRALLGKGLKMLVGDGDPRAAAALLDRGAAAFGLHIGSWLAAGWAHLIAGDFTAARDRFERALALDDRFAETQGSLAVLDLAEGRADAAKRRADTALRLDRNCLSAALATSLILERAGKASVAERVREATLARPLAPGGRSIAEAMAVLGLGGRRALNRR